MDILWEVLETPAELLQMYPLEWRMSRRDRAVRALRLLLVSGVVSSIVLGGDKLRPLAITAGAGLLFLIAVHLGRTHLEWNGLWPEMSDEEIVERGARAGMPGMMVHNVMPGMGMERDWFPEDVGGRPLDGHELIRRARAGTMEGTTDRQYPVGMAWESTPVTKVSADGMVAEHPLNLGITSNLALPGDFGRAPRDMYGAV